MNRNALLSFAIIFCMVIGASRLHAQSSNPFSGDNMESMDLTPLNSFSNHTMTAFTDPQIALKIELIPPYPRPGEKVIARISGFETDLPNDSIEWSLNGDVVARGAGQTTLSLVAPRAGDTMYILARARETTGREYSAGYPLTPGTVELIWESDTYTPPFFEGKALQTAGSKIRLTALPSISISGEDQIPPSAFMYTWRQGNKVMTALSGIGRQTVTVTNKNLIGPLDITVTVTDPKDSRIGGTGKLSLDVVQPKIVFYEDHPLMGIRYDTALPVTTTLHGEEVQIIAEPFYFTAARRSADDLQYSWLINGTESKDLSNTGSAIVLRGATNAKAAANIDVRVRNKTQYMQSARQAISVISTPEQ